jgi:hypothetical protein
MEGARDFPRTAHHKRIYRPTSSDDIQTNIVLADYYVVDEGVQPHHTLVLLSLLSISALIFSSIVIFWLCLVEREMSINLSLKMKSLKGITVISTSKAADFSNKLFSKKTMVNSAQTLNSIHTNDNPGCQTPPKSRL